MSKLNNFTMYASKTIEIFFFVLIILLVISIIGSAFLIGWANREIKKNDINLVAEAQKLIDENTDADYGFSEKGVAEVLTESKLIRKDGTVNAATIILYLLYGLFNCAAFCMIFRNIHLILKTAKGKTWFSQGETPFQKDITRMIREIGIFLFILAGIEFILGFFVPDISVTLVYIVIGILMLSLSSFFSYGEQLQAEADGLL
ncbi:MAG: hypothetical protein J6T73_00545 [Clostridia bacterium]|nr:hypothetical protein [Clostridia bacterium]